MWWVSKHLENWRGMPILNCVFKQSFTENVIFLKDKTTVWWKTERIQFLAKKIVCANASSGNMLRGFNEWMKRKVTWDETGVRSCIILGIVLSWNVDFIVWVTSYLICFKEGRGMPGFFQLLFREWLETCKNEERTIKPTAILHVREDDLF